MAGGIASLRPIGGCVHAGNCHCHSVSLLRSVLLFVTLLRSVMACYLQGKSERNGEGVMQFVVSELVNLFKLASAHRAGTQVHYYI